MIDKIISYGSNLIRAADMRKRGLAGLNEQGGYSGGVSGVDGHQAGIRRYRAEQRVRLRNRAAPSMLICNTHVLRARFDGRPETGAIVCRGAREDQ